MFIHCGIWMIALLSVWQLIGSISDVCTLWQLNDWQYLSLLWQLNDWQYLLSFWQLCDWYLLLMFIPCGSWVIDICCYCLYLVAAEWLTISIVFVAAEGTELPACLQFGANGAGVSVVCQHVLRPLALASTVPQGIWPSRWVADQRMISNEWLWLRALCHKKARACWAMKVKRRLCQWDENIDNFIIAFSPHFF